jgi:hypothetical protein
VQPVLDAERVLTLQRWVREVPVADNLFAYAAALGGWGIGDPDVDAKLRRMPALGREDWIHPVLAQRVHRLPVSINAATVEDLARGPARSDDPSGSCRTLG